MGILKIAGLVLLFVLDAILATLGLDTAVHATFNGAWIMDLSYAACVLVPIIGAGVIRLIDNEQTINSEWTDQLKKRSRPLDGLIIGSTSIIAAWTILILLASDNAPAGMPALYYPAITAIASSVLTFNLTAVVFVWPVKRQISRRQDLLKRPSR